MTATASILNDYDKYLNSLIQARQSLVDRHYQIDDEIAALKKEQAQIDEYLGKVLFQDSFDLSSLSADKNVDRNEEKSPEVEHVAISEDSAEAPKPVDETPENAEEETTSKSDDTESVSDNADGVQQEFDLSAAIKESEKPVEAPESDIDEDLGLSEVDSDDWSDLSQDEDSKDDVSDSDNDESTDVDDTKKNSTSDDKKSDGDEKPKKTSNRRRRSASSQSRPSSRRKTKKDDWQSDPDFDTSEDIEHIDFGF